MPLTGRLKSQSVDLGVAFERTLFIVLVLCRLLISAYSNAFKRDAKFRYKTHNPRNRHNAQIELRPPADSIPLTSQLLVLIRTATSTTSTNRYYC